MLKIIKEKTLYHTYSLESDYNKETVEYCQFLNDALGWKEFQWDSGNRKWRFKDPEVIIMMKRKFPELIIDVEVQKEVALYKQNREVEAVREVEANRIKGADKSMISIQGIKGDLYEYQKLGIEFLVNSGGRALLADSPGVGKTVQALGYITHMGHRRSLIVCPASVKFSWESEAEKWTKLKTFIVDPQTKLTEIGYDVNLVIINFDILKKFYKEFMKYDWACLVVDESHLIKSPTAIRSKVIKLLSKHIENAIFLTGTPVLSRPVEMFNVLNMINPREWNNYYEYATKYCDGKRGYWGFEAKGATNLPELKERISKYFLRRTKEEVLKELPPKNFIEVVVDLPEEERKQYDLVESNLVKYLKEYKKDKTEKEIEKSLSAEKLVKLNLLREISALGKISTAKELIDSIVEAGEKVLVFSSFVSPLKEMMEMYEENSVSILGDTPIEERGEIVKRFQNNPKTQIFFGGTKSAGVGITLTAASNVICLDWPWNPADLQQQIDRAHRPSAVYESLSIYQIFGRDTIDSFMKKLHSHKQKIIDQLMGGGIKEQGTEELIEDYIKTLKKKHE